MSIKSLAPINWAHFLLLLRYMNAHSRSYRPSVHSAGNAPFGILLLLLVLLLVMGIRPAAAQNSSPRSGEAVADRLRERVLTADAASLAAETTYSVEIALFGEGRFYSRGQATLLLRDMFKDYPPTGFRIDRFTRTSSAGFVEAEMTTSASAERLKWIVRYQVSGGIWKIREMVIERAHE